MGDKHGKALKSLVLAAGLGTRLRPLTNTIPKPLATVLNVPLINAAVRRCVLAGSNDLAVNTHHLATIMEDYVGKHFLGLGAKTLFLSHESPDILGTGGALAAVSNWWGESPLLVYNGDILSDLPLNDLVTRHQQSRRLVTMAIRKTPPEDGGRSVWINESGYVENIAKKADLPLAQANLREAGFACAYVAEPGLREFLPKEPVLYDVILAFNNAIKAGHKIAAVEYQGFWADIGTPRSLWETNLLVAAMPERQKKLLLGETPLSRVSIHDPSIVIDNNSVVSPGAKIGAAARIENSVLLDGAVVHASEVLKNTIRGWGLDLSFLDL